MTEFVDLAFEVEGGWLPLDHAEALEHALALALPWLSAIEAAAIHPLRGAPTDRGTLLLSRRSRLTLRLPRERAAAALALGGTALEVAGQRLRIGAGRLRELAPFTTLYARCIVTGSEDEAAFMADVARLLEGLRVRCKFMCGRKRRIAVEGREVGGFPVMLHEVALDDSLTLQQTGLGRLRLYGCGVLVPHKSIRAVRREE